VVNIGSLSGLLAAPFMGPYCASKAALESLSDSLRMELAPFGVEVSVVEPGPTQSLVWKKSVAARPKLRKASPASARAAYEKSWTRFDALVQSAADRAGPVARVTDAVLDALTAAEPKTRYVLDDGQSLRLAALPDRERDAKLLSGFGLPGRK
jgi:NAD(P)-dependent dehydrogenase (short-subunit alcohol dehydrogenase family)